MKIQFHNSRLMQLLIATWQMTDKNNAFLFILSILSSIYYYLRQILLAMRLKICPLRPKFVSSRQTIRKFV